MTTTAADDGDYGAAEDRLPWLESAEEEYREGPSAARVVGLIVGGLVVIALAIWGFNAMRSTSPAKGTGALIQAQEGDYKVRPDERGGMKVEGEGDTVFATSEGTTGKGAVDTSAVPEAPVKGKAVAAEAPKTAGTAKVVAAVPASSGRLTAQKPNVELPKLSSGGGGSLVQLGSFPSEGAANGAWSTLSKRFSYVGELGKSVEKAEVDGRTVYRLRVNAGSHGQAQAICGKLKVAGEACFIPS